jgi:hypothetical protein
MLHRHPQTPGAKLRDKLGHLHLHLPELHEHPPTHHESIYFEAGRMSREMEHL